MQSSDTMQVKWSPTLTLKLPTLSCQKPAVYMLDIFISAIGLVINLISRPPSAMDQFSPHAKLFATLFLQLMNLKPWVHSANAKECVAILPSLLVLGHKQPPTPLKIDNSTTDVFVNSSMKPKKSKTWDMNMNWLRDKEVLKQTRVYWDKGKNNDADYFTKHFLPVFTGGNDLVIFNLLILLQHQSICLKPSSQDCARVC